MKHFLHRLQAVVLLGLLPALAAGQRASSSSRGSLDLSYKPRPNLLVIVADDVGWRDVDASIPTPTIDALASAGVRYRRAYATPLCSPTRYSLLFGMYSFREQLGTFINTCDPNDLSVPIQRLALPEVLQSRGYSTFSTGKWHLNTVATSPVYEAPRMFGFDEEHAGWIDNLGKIGDYFNWGRIDNGLLTLTTEYNTTAITQATIDWWTATPGPKFAWVAYQAPHAPFHAAPANLLPPGYVIGPGTRGLFESMIVAMDTEMGNLLSAIDLRNTLVIFMGDNGTPEAAVAPDQDPAKVKSSVYEGGINVPFIAAGWGAARNLDCDALISTVDLFATVLDLLQVPVPAGHAIDSVSFAPTLSQPSLGGRTWLFSQAYAPNGPGPTSYNVKAVVTATHKLWVRNGLERLYDLVNDPNEEQPLNIITNFTLYSTLRAYLDSIEAQGAP